MKKKQIIGLLIAGLLFAVIGVISVFVNTAAESIIGDAAEEILAGGSNFDPPDDDYIAVVKVQGTIQEQASDTTDILSGQNSGYQHDTTMEYLDELMDDENNKGILLYVDSPGGAVYESEELYDKLMEYKKITKQPIWTYMAHYAASGGYMASVSSDKIYANKNTVTGSIGVIMSGYDLTGLYKKLGIRYVSITSGKNKDYSVCGHLCGQSCFCAAFCNRGKSRKCRRRKALRRFTLPRPGYRHGTPKAGAIPTSLYPDTIDT